MSSWILVPSLVKLRSEFNEISPNRDKGADGSIGNSAHTSSSDHTPDEDSNVLRDHDGDDKNEVHALDIDSSGPWPGSGTAKQRFHRIVMRIIAGENAKWLSPNDKCRLRYVIWDSHIYHIDNDFEPVLYSLRAEDPHTNHAHFSGRYETACENDTRPWGVAEEDDDMATITQADFNARMDAWWNDRMKADSTPSDALLNLRRAPWNQPVGSAGDTMYQVIHRAAQAAILVPLVQSLSEALATFATSESQDDAANREAIAQLRSAVDQANQTLQALANDQR